MNIPHVTLTLPTVTFAAGSNFQLRTSLNELNQLLPNILDAVCDIEPSAQAIRNEILDLFQRLGPQANP